MSWRGKRTLVTGAYGFVGRRLVARLSAEGAAVTALDRARADVTDAAALAARLREAAPAVIFHLAGWTGAGRDAEAYERALTVNTQGTLNLLRAARSLPGLERVVVAGSALEYGPQPAPFREDAAEAASDPYGLSKLFATRLCRAFHRRGGLPVVVLRLTVVYGPGQSGSMFLPSLLAAAAAGRPLDMTGGEQLRDYVHVDDAVEALLLAAAAPGAAGEVFNVGGGEPLALKELPRLLQRAAGRPVEVRLGALPYREGEVMDYRVDTAKAARALGWRPRRGLEEGLRSCL